MSNHESAVVHVATSAYQSPELFHSKVVSDVGLFAESLLYYESVFVDATSPDHFVAFTKGLVDRGFSYADLISLTEAKLIRFVYGVTVNPYVDRNKITNEPDPRIINGFYAIAEDGRQHPGYFAKKFLDTDSLRSAFTDGKSLLTKEYDRFCRVANDSAKVLDTDPMADGVVRTSYAQVTDPNEHAELLADVLNSYAQAQGSGYSIKPTVKVRRISARDIGNYRRASWTILRNSVDEDGSIWAILADVNLSDFRNQAQISRIIRTFPLSYAGVTSMAVQQRACFQQICSCQTQSAAEWVPNFPVSAHLRQRVARSNHRT